MAFTAVCASSATPQQTLLPVQEKADLRACLSNIALAASQASRTFKLCFHLHESTCCWLAERGHGGAQRDWLAPQTGDQEPGQRKGLEHEQHPDQAL